MIKGEIRQKRQSKYTIYKLLLFKYYNSELNVRIADPSNSYWRDQYKIFLATLASSVRAFKSNMSRGFSILSTVSEKSSARTPPV